MVILSLYKIKDIIDLNFKESINISFNEFSKTILSKTEVLCIGTAYIFYHF